MQKFIQTTISSGLLSGLLLSTAIAQSPPVKTLPRSNPNPDRFLQPLPSPELPPKPIESSPTPRPTPAPSSIQIPVRKVEVVGATVLNAKDIQRITQTVEGKSVMLAELQGVADEITRLYSDRGYITSRAVVVEQAIADGVVEIQVIEGSVEKIEIQGLERLRDKYVRDRLKLGIGTPLNRNSLEDQLRLLRIDPLFETVEASLKPGSTAGQSILTVQIKEAKALSGFVGADNFSPPSVGSERFGGILNYRNVTGLGDELSAAYFRSAQGGSNVFDFNYRVPINAMNGTIQLRVAPSRSKIIDPTFSVLNIRANSDLYEFSYRQPLIRSPREEFALSLGFAFQNGQTFLFQNIPTPFGIGPDANGNSRTRVLKFGQDYIRRDLQGAWAIRSQFSFGLGIFDATKNTDPIPDGRFFSWLGQLQRAQRLGADNLLIAQAEVQLTPNSLLPSQQFVIGGGQNLRGFRQNARSGDNGFRISLEDQITLQKTQSGTSILKIAPFIDFGTVGNRSNNPNTLPSQRFLAGGGLGVILEPAPGLTIRADYAVPFVNLSDRGENAQDKAFYFSAGYSF